MHNGDGFARPLTLEEIEGGQRDILERDRERIEAITSRIPEPQNHAYALALTQVTELQFRARRFLVPPVSYRVGLRLQFLHRRYTRLSKVEDADAATFRELLEIMEEFVSLCWSLVRPTSFWGRLFWRLRENPFLHANAEEIGQLHVFFWARATLSHARVRISATSIRERSGISQTTWRSSPSTSPPGFIGLDPNGDIP